ncbi:MAG: hydroxyacid dehydrogenase [Betaproteobacteria bacterium]|nr:hydroxyacid dehydrogenase [Betaproteobacteria bacterium]
MRILISEFMDSDAVRSLEGRFDVHYDPKLVDQPDELATRAADCDALIVRNRTQVRGALLAGAKRLRVVGRLGVGLDNIDCDACRDRGIEVIPATGANTVAVAEYVIATAFMLLRGAYLSSPDVAAGRWPRAALSEGRELAGKTLGLVGFGGIGRHTAMLARALGMAAIAHDPAIAENDAAWQASGVAPTTLDALLSRADVISLHVPLVPATRHLIDARRIATMKPSAVLINTARGGVIDEAALALALREGRLAGAALDVFETEPLPDGSALADTPRLLLTPHIAGVTAESNERVSALIAERVAAHLAPAGQVI